MKRPQAEQDSSTEYMAHPRRRDALGREIHFRPKINRLRLSKKWRDLGDLKRGLLDIWTEERNTFAKEVMKDIEDQRKEPK